MTRIYNMHENLHRDFVTKIQPVQSYTEAEAEGLERIYLTGAATKHGKPLADFAAKESKKARERNGRNGLGVSYEAAGGPRGVRSRSFRSQVFDLLDGEKTTSEIADMLGAKREKTRLAVKCLHEAGRIAKVGTRHNAKGPDFIIYNKLAS